MLLLLAHLPLLAWCVAPRRLVDTWGLLNRIKGKKCPTSLEIGGIYAFGVCWVLIWWKLLLPDGMTRGKFLTLSVPQFLHLKMR